MKKYLLIPALLCSLLLSAQNSNDLDYLVRYQKEQTAKKKRTAMLQIGFGVAMFALLVVGLQRRRKEKGKKDK